MLSMKIVKYYYTLTNLYKFRVTIISGEKTLVEEFFVKLG